MTDRVSDAAIHAAVAQSLRDDDLAPMSRIQLIGLCEYAASRGADPTAARRTELVDALESLRDNELVAPLWPGEPYSVAASALGVAIGRTDDSARNVQSVLRPLLVRHLDDEMTTTMPLIDAFRGSCAMRDALVAWIAENVDGRFAGASVDRIGIGHSRAMFRITASDGTRVVARVEQGGVFGTASAEEHRVMQALAERGYPVAPIVAAEPTGGTIGQPFFVMEFVEGAAAADERVLDDQTAAAFVDALAALHRLEASGIEFDIRPPEPSAATPAQIERWRGVYRRSTHAPNPLLEEAASWLLQHAPKLDRLSIVHGDAGPGNFVHAGGRVVAVTDWEFAHAGDPAEDWAFCLTMRGSRTMPREAWLRLFRERAGVEMSDDEWRYWEAFNLFKGACANRTCLSVFEDGRNRAPNMAIIGTALHQVFLRRLVAIVHDEGGTA